MLKHVKNTGKPHNARLVKHCDSDNIPFSQVLDLWQNFVALKIQQHMVILRDVAKNFGGFWNFGGFYSNFVGNFMHF